MSKVLFIFMTISIISFFANASEKTDYREFLACVDEVLEKNQGMNPAVAEDICIALLEVEEKDVDLNHVNYCEMILMKKW